MRREREGGRWEMVRKGVAGRGGRGEGLGRVGCVLYAAAAALASSAVGSSGRVGSAWAVVVGSLPSCGHPFIPL